MIVSDISATSFCNLFVLLVFFFGGLSWFVRGVSIYIYIYFKFHHSLSIIRITRKKKCYDEVI